MMRHRTEQELIEYQFKLASDSQMRQIAEHLEKCGQCRELMERLKRRFSALDLLREEVKVSEDLISKVAEETQGGVSNLTLKKRLLRSARNDKWRWIGAAAAVLVAGLSLLLVSNLPKEREKKHQFAKEPTTVASDIKLNESAESMRAVGLSDGAAAMKPLASALSKEETGAWRDLEVSGIGGVAEGTIPEQPPFAPASAIELVTLPRRENVQLTIYNSADLTLVRERRNLTLKKGWNWLQFMWANTLIDPTSLTLEPLEQKDKVEIEQLVFPARLREIGRWLIRSEVSGQVPFEITYFTSGLSWRAFYMGTLAKNEKTMRLESYVRVDNGSGEDYENAQTRLIVGTIHILDQIADLARRQYPYDSPVTIYRLYSDELADKKNAPVLGERIRGIVAADELGLERKEVKKEGLSEYFLYTIGGTETIPDKWGKRLLSFEANDIPVKSLYKYDEERWGPQTIRFVAFANDTKHNLGQTPIPNGDVRIYSQADDLGYLSYVGGTSIKYIPVNEKVELNLGPARLVTVEPKLMDFKTENYIFDTKNNVSGWDEVQTWKIEITNTRTLPIEVEITRGLGTAYWTLQFDEKEISYEKYDVTHARFKMSLEPRSKRTFEWTVRTYHGAREEALTKTK
jgi:anti-sigma-K factor RskA